jgi:hypothetical protein
MNNSIVKGSLGDIAKKQNTPLAETWMGVDMVCLCDTSGSMYREDSRDGKRRYDVMIRELEKIQNGYPGKVAVIGFSSNVEWYPNGVPYFEANMTDMEKALEFIKPIDGLGIAITLISDGVPDDEDATLRVARSFQTKINTIYVGPEHEREGQIFLERLASLTGGTYQEDFRVSELENKIAGLLEG